MRELGTGFGSTAYETAGGVVFRVARTAEAAAGHSVEARLLPSLAPALPARVPEPSYRIAPAAPELQHGALGHQKLRGEPLSADTASAIIAEDLAQFFLALHAFPIADARRLGVPEAPAWRERVLAIADLLPVLRPKLSPPQRDVLDAWWHEAVADASMTPPAPALRHGDAWYENVLADGDPPRVTAVLDWGAVAIGDPAEDLAPQFYLGAEFAEALLAQYGADEQLHARVRRNRELREFAGARWSIDHQDEAELAESVEKLLRSPIVTK